MKRSIVVLALLAALLTGVTAPAATGTVHAAPVHAAAVHSQTHAFDKTRFVAHLAFAFGAFHHWIYKPYKAGDLSRHHFFTVIKAGAAALFVYHELKVDYNLAKGSKSKTLRALVSPLNSLSNGFNALKGKVLKGDTSSVNALQNQSSSFEKLAGKNGFKINEQTPSSLSGTP